MAVTKILDLSTSSESPVTPALSKDTAALQQARNVMVGGDWAGRRRKGFRITCAVDTSFSFRAMMFSAEHTFTGTGGDLYRFYLVGNSSASLYSQPSATGTLSSATTGFTAYEPAAFIPWNDTMIVWTASKRVAGRLTAGSIVWDDLHIAAPSAGTAAAAGAGTALPPGTYTYYLCAYNSNRAVQSGPSAAFTVTLAAANNVSITNIPAVAGQVTHHKIYRTEANGVVAKFVASTTATTYTDSTVPTGLSSTDILPRDVFGSPFTSAAPTAEDTTNGGRLAVQYKGMLLAAGSRVGTAAGFPKRIYFTQPGSPDRWSENYYIDIPCNGNITAMCVQGGSVLVCTPYEIWSVFGTGNYTSGPAPINDFVVTNVSRSHGVAAPKAIFALPNFAVGVSTCGPIAIYQAGNDQGTVIPLKTPNMDKFIVPLENYAQTCIGYNPRRREIWIAMPIKGELDDSENRRVLAYSIDDLTKVAVYDLRVSAFMEMPGNNTFNSSTVPGYDLYFSDWIGNHCQAEYSDGDGLLGNEAYVVLGDTVGTMTVGATRITPTTATGFPTPNGLRGVRVVGIPASPTQEPEVRTILTNSSTYFNVDDAWVNVTAGDKYFLGGILDDRITSKIYLTAEEDRIARAFVSKQQLFWGDIVGEES